MTEYDVDVRSVAVYSCRTEDQEDETPNEVGVYEGDQLEEDEDGAEVHDIVERMLEVDALDKRYGNRKNARIHQWIDGDVDDNNLEESAQDIFEEIRQGDQFNTNAETLATRYIRQDLSAQDILLIVRYSRNGRDYSAILKTPYLEEAREIDISTASITENEYVIEANTDKCILYPHANYESELDESRARVFQLNGASNYAKYWYRFAGLAKKELPDEVVEQHLRERAKESDENAAFTDFEDFEDSSEDLFDDDTHLQGEVQLSIGEHRQFRVSLRELKNQDDVILARDGDQIYVILSGATPQITTGSSDQKKPVFGSLDGIKELSDVLSNLA